MSNDPQHFADIFQARNAKKPPAYQWQDFALQIIDELKIPNFKKNSVFKICKTYSRPYIEKCFNDTKELCKTGEYWKYFFKVVESGKKELKN